VVEDDTPLRNALVSTIQAAGYEVVAVGDGAPAVQALHSSRCEVILLDIGLPFVDGWRVLKSLEGPRQPPVIIISAPR
jgi:DNA-binding response OmpR family regulator